jgi:flagellar protein FliS
MLFDGAVRFVDQARVHMEQNEFEPSHELLLRTQRIMLELMSALDQGALQALPGEIDQNLTGLYLYVYRELVRANSQRDLGALENASKILGHLRETWRLAYEKMDPEDRKGLTSASSSAVAGRGINIKG